MYYLNRRPKKKKDPTEKPARVKRGKPDLVEKLDRVFSTYIRLRDCMPNGYGKCISCGQIKPYDQLDCGHYHSRIHMATRYDEFNCHAECRACNRFSADHLDAYRDNLIRKIGQNMYDILKVKAKTNKKWSDFELEAMIKHYRAKAKELSIKKGIKVNLR